MIPPSPLTGEGTQVYFRKRRAWEDSQTPISRALARPCFARLLALLVGQPDRSATGAFPLHCSALFNHGQVTPFMVYIAAFGRFMRRSRIPKHPCAEVLGRTLAFDLKRRNAILKTDVLPKQ